MISGEKCSNLGESEQLEEERESKRPSAVRTDWGFMGVNRRL